MITTTSYQTDLKPAVIHARGGWIEVTDQATGEIIGQHNLPVNGKPGAFARRIVAWGAVLGYEIRTCDSMAGPGIPALLIGV